MADKDEKVRKFLLRREKEARRHQKDYRFAEQPLYRRRADRPAKEPERAFKRVPERRTRGEAHAETQAWSSPGTEEQKIARMNEAREAFTGTRMSRGRGIGRNGRRNGGARR